MGKGQRNFEENDDWKDKATSYRKKGGIRKRNKKISRAKKKEIEMSFKGESRDRGINENKWIY